MTRSRPARCAALGGIVAVVLSACHADTMSVDELRTALESEPSLDVVPSGGRSLGPVRVAEPTNPGNFTGQLTPLRLTHEIEVPGGGLAAVLDDFATRAIADGFEAPVVACSDLPAGLRVAHLFAIATREGRRVGLHVIVRSQPPFPLTVSVTVYDGENQSADPVGRPNAWACAEPSSSS